MIRTIIIDDEDRSRSILMTLLERYCSEITVVGTAPDIDEGAKLIEEHKPELVFLDISMPGGSGFDLLNELPEIDFEVVFITAHSEYAIKAIKADAIDYLLKPLNISELQDAVHKVSKQLETKAGKNEHFRRRQAVTEKIGVPVNDGLKFISVQHIVRLAAKGSYTEIFMDDGSHILSSKQLKEYEDMLSPTLFFRTHHSHIINLHFVKHYHRGEGGCVTMTDGSCIDIAKRKKKEFLELFQH